jgi:hypothetical protein
MPHEKEEYTIYTMGGHKKEALAHTGFIAINMETGNSIHQNMNNFYFMTAAKIVPSGSGMSIIFYQHYFFTVKVTAWCNSSILYLDIRIGGVLNPRRPVIKRNYV